MPTIRVELVFVHGDGMGGRTYELAFVDETGRWAPQLLVKPDGTLELVDPDDEETDDA